MCAAPVTRNLPANAYKSEPILERPFESAGQFRYRDFSSVGGVKSNFSHPRLMPECGSARKVTATPKSWPRCLGVAAFIRHCPRAKALAGGIGAGRGVNSTVLFLAKLQDG